MAIVPVSPRDPPWADCHSSGTSGSAPPIGAPARRSRHFPAGPGPQALTDA